MNVTPDELKYRRCQVPACDYKELRGSNLGGFICGNFVCAKHFAYWSRSSEDIVREWREIEWG